MLLNLKTLAATTFVVPQEARQHFSTYFLRLWDAYVVQDRVKDGKISHEGIDYAVVWVRPPVTCYAAPKVACSFRRLHGVATTPYVLIKPWYC